MEYDQNEQNEATYDYENFKGIFYNNPENANYIDSKTGAHFNFESICEKLKHFMNTDKINLIENEIHPIKINNFKDNKNENKKQKEKEIENGKESDFTFDKIIKKHSEMEKCKEAKKIDHIDNLKNQIDKSNDFSSSGKDVNINLNLNIKSDRHKKENDIKSKFNNFNNNSPLLKHNFLKFKVKHQEIEEEKKEILSPTNNSIKLEKKDQLFNNKLFRILKLSLISPCNFKLPLIVHNKNFSNHVFNAKHIIINQNKNILYNLKFEDNKVKLPYKKSVVRNHRTNIVQKPECFDYNYDNNYNHNHQYQLKDSSYNHIINQNLEFTRNVNSEKNLSCASSKIKLTISKIKPKNIVINNQNSFSKLYNHKNVNNCMSFHKNESIPKTKFKINIPKNVGNFDLSGVKSNRK